MGLKVKSGIKKDTKEFYYWVGGKIDKFNGSHWYGILCEVIVEINLK
jgi:hypothetical protein